MARNQTRAEKGKATGISLAPHEACWIKYQLDLRKITYKTVAARAGLSENMVAHYLTCRKNSERIKNALTEILGYKSFENLLAASRGKEEAA